MIDGRKSGFAKQKEVPARFLLCHEIKCEYCKYTAKKTGYLLMRLKDYVT